MISGKDQDGVSAVIVQMMKALPDGVGGALKPVWTFGGYLGREDLNETVGEAAEAIGSRNMSIQRSGVVLSKDEYSMHVGVDAVRDRDVNEAVFAAERHRRFCAALCERVKPLTRPASKYQRQHAFACHSVASQACA
jgi:hypothetical protein